MIKLSVSKEDFTSRLQKIKLQLSAALKAEIDSHSFEKKYIGIGMSMEQSKLADLVIRNICERSWVSYIQLSEWYLQVAAANIMTYSDAIQLFGYGINPVKILSEHLRISGMQAIEKIKNSEVNAELALSILMKVSERLTA